MIINQQETHDAVCSTCGRTIETGEFTTWSQNGGAEMHVKCPTPVPVYLTTNRVLEQIERASA